VTTEQCDQTAREIKRSSLSKNSALLHKEDIFPKSLLVKVWGISRKNGQNIEHVEVNLDDSLKKLLPNHWGI
jgi:hypothetical protein